MDSRSFLLGLALVASSPLVAFEIKQPQISGSLSMDAQSPFQPEGSSNNVYLSGAKLKFKGDLAEDWKYEIVAKHPATQLTVMGFDDVIQIKSVIVKYKFADSATFTFGKSSPRFSQAAGPNETYIERDIGILSDKIGDGVGAKVEGVLYDKYGYSLGFWKATARRKIDTFGSKIDVRAEDEEVATNELKNAQTQGAALPKVTLSATEDLKIGLGGRVNAVLYNKPNFMWGTGIGFQSLSAIIPMLVEYNTEPTPLAPEPISAFDSRYAVTLDHSFGTQYATLNVAYHHFKYQRESDAKVSTPISDIPAGTNVFQRKNMANSGYIELTYLLIGKGYSMNKDHGVVADIELSDSYGALEIAARAGTESYFNAAAAQYLGSAYNEETTVPFTFSKKDGYNLVLINPTEMTNGTHGADFHVRLNGFSFHVNYKMNKNITFKAEYYNQKVDVIGVTANTTLEKREGVRLRSEYSF